MTMASTQGARLRRRGRGCGGRGGMLNAGFAGAGGGGATGAGGGVGDAAATGVASGDGTGAAGGGGTGEAMEGAVGAAAGLAKGMASGLAMACSSNDMRWGEDGGWGGGNAAAQWAHTVASRAFSLWQAGQRWLMFQLG